MMMCLTLCRSPSAKTSFGPVSEIKTKAAHNAGSVRRMVEPPCLSCLAHEQIRLRNKPRAIQGTTKSRPELKPGEELGFTPNCEQGESALVRRGCQDEKLCTSFAS